MESVKKTDKKFLTSREAEYPKRAYSVERQGNEGCKMVYIGGQRDIDKG
jgi:hypothetical protein